MYKVVVHSVAEEPAFVLAEFAHGPVPLPMVERATDAMEVTLRRRARPVDGTTLPSERLKVSTEAVDFVGDSRDDAKYLLVVMRKKARVLDVLASGAGSLFTMCEVVKGFEPVMPVETKGFRLSELSGHRQRKRVSEDAKFSLAGKEVVAGEKAGELLDLAKASSVAGDEAAGGDEDTLTSLIPPHDATTTDARAIYSIDTLIPEEVREALTSAVVVPMEETIADAAALEAFLSDSAPLHMRDWLGVVLRDMATAKSATRRPRALAVAFVLMAACYLEEVFPKRGGPRNAGSSSGGNVGVRLLGFEWKLRLVPKMNRAFADKSTQTQKYTLGDRRRTRILNYATVAMLSCMPGAQVNLQHVCDVLRLQDKQARQMCAVVGASTTKKRGGKDALNVSVSVLDVEPEIWTLKAPLKLPKVRFAAKKK